MRCLSHCINIQFKQRFSLLHLYLFYMNIEHTLSVSLMLDVVCSCTHYHTTPHYTHTQTKILSIIPTLPLLQRPMVSTCLHPFGRNPHRPPANQNANSPPNRHLHSYTRKARRNQTTSSRRRIIQHTSGFNTRGR